MSIGFVSLSTQYSNLRDRLDIIINNQPEVEKLFNTNVLLHRQAVETRQHLDNLEEILYDITQSKFFKIWSMYGKIKKELIVK